MNQCAYYQVWNNQQVLDIYINLIKQKVRSETYHEGDSW